MLKLKTIVDVVIVVTLLKKGEKENERGKVNKFGGECEREGQKKNMYRKKKVFQIVVNQYHQQIVKQWGIFDWTAWLVDWLIDWLIGWLIGEF